MFPILEGILLDTPLQDAPKSFPNCSRGFPCIIVDAEAGLRVLRLIPQEP